MPETGERIDYLAAYHFTVEVEGIAKAQFSECSGLQAETEVFSYEEGGCNDYIHKLPGRVKFSNLTLKRGVSSSNDLWIWFQSAIQGFIERKNVSVILHNSDDSEAKRWNFFRAYPVKYVSPPLVASQSQISIETMELAHEGMNLA